MSTAVLRRHISERRQEGKFFEHVTITSGRFSNSTFEGCDIRGVDLIGCSISDSSLNNCKLMWSDVGLLQHPFDDTFYDSSARDCEMKQCKLTNVDIRRSQIADPTRDYSSPMISQCRIQTSQVESEEIENSFLTNCKVITYAVFGSALHECELQMKADQGQTPQRLAIQKSPLASGKFVPEIRIIIFAYALRDTWSEHRAKVPSLIVALRADPQLYNEALDIFCSLHTFNLSRRNWRSRMLMGATAFHSIRPMILEANMHNSAQVPRALLNSPNLRDLQIIAAPVAPEKPPNLTEIARDWTTQGGFLNNSSISVRYDHSHPILQDILNSSGRRLEEEYKRLKRLISPINRGLGMDAKKEKTTRDGIIKTTWSWASDPDNTLS